MPSHVYVFKLNFQVHFLQNILFKTKYSPFCWSWSRREMQSNYFGTKRATLHECKKKTVLAEKTGDELVEPWVYGVTYDDRVTWKSRTTQSMVSYFPQVDFLTTQNYPSTACGLRPYTLYPGCRSATRWTRSSVCVRGITASPLRGHANICMYSIER